MDADIRVSKRPFTEERKHLLGHRKVLRAAAAALTAGTLLATAGTAEAQRAPSMGEGAPVGQSGIQLYNFRDYLSGGSGEILCPASPQPATPYCTPTLPANTVDGPHGAPVRVPAGE